MFTICISFSTPTKQKRSHRSEQSSDPKNSTAPRPRPPVLIFLDPPLANIDIYTLISSGKYKENIIITFQKKSISKTFIKAAYGIFVELLEKFRHFL